MSIITKNYAISAEDIAQIKELCEITSLEFCYAAAFDETKKNVDASIFRNKDGFLKFLSCNSAPFTICSVYQMPINSSDILRTNISVIDAFVKSKADKLKKNLSAVKNGLDYMELDGETIVFPPDILFLLDESEREIFPDEVMDGAAKDNRPEKEQDKSLSWEDVWKQILMNKKLGQSIGGNREVQISFYDDVDFSLFMALEQVNDEHDLEWQDIAEKEEKAGEMGRQGNKKPKQKEEEISR